MEHQANEMLEAVRENVRQGRWRRASDQASELAIILKNLQRAMDEMPNKRYWRHDKPPIEDL